MGPLLRLSFFFNNAMNRTIAEHDGGVWQRQLSLLASAQDLPAKIIRLFYIEALFRLAHTGMRLERGLCIPELNRKYGAI